MAKRDDTGELEEQLADALAQVDSLQTAAADAEARAATARAELTAVRESHDAAQAQIAEIEAARGSAEGELSQVRSQLRDAAARYREARLAAAPEVPHDLVPAVESLDEVDREFEAAQRVVNQLREKMAEESQAAARALRVPAGSPVRRPQDLSVLSPAEKIKLGLQERDRQ